MRTIVVHESKSSLRREILWFTATITLLFWCHPGTSLLAGEKAKKYGPLMQQVEVDIKPQMLRTAVADLLDKQGIAWVVDDNVRFVFDAIVTDGMRMPTSISVRSVLFLLLEQHDLRFDWNGQVLTIEADHSDEDPS